MAARFFLHNPNPKYARRKAFYARRISRIVVNAPMAVAVRISKIENIETQTIMKTQPYVEILKHARGQWLAYKSPEKPKSGVPSEHESRKMWNEFVNVAKITFNNQNFATRDAHMVLYDEKIYDVWISILQKQLRVPGRQPTISMFRCLRTLEDTDVCTIQDELMEGKIFLIKSPDHRDIMDLEERSKYMKRTKVFEKEITKIFQDADPKSKVSIAGMNV